MGHLGVDRVTTAARDQFFWPGMQQDIEHFVSKVCTCLKQKKTTPSPAKSPTTTHHNNRIIRALMY